MTAPLRLGALLTILLATLAVLWLVADALYARHIRAGAQAPNAPHAPATPFLLNPTGTPALLLIHGFADGPAVYAKLAPPLAEAGFAVRALRLPGSGVPPTGMKGITLADWRQAIDGEIADLRAAEPARPVWLVGHSLGGALAFDAALRPANSVAGLVMIAPLVEVSRARSPVLAPETWFNLLDHLLIFTDAIASRLPKDLHDPDARATYQTDRFIHRDMYRALFAATDAIRPRAAEWHGPLVMAIAANDQIVDSSASRFFFAATNAAPSALAEYHAAGHVLPLDYGHDKLAAKIIRFIQEAPMPAPPPPVELATFAGGCFWCIEEIFRQQPGVRCVTSGYTGGETTNPTYRDVCSGETGHAEAVQIEFDPTQTSYAALLDLFLRAHDPTQLNRQEADVGTQYRSAIFTHGPAQAEAARAALAAANASGQFTGPIVTQIEPAGPFYPAEADHQEYYLRNKSAPYCRMVIRPKLNKLGLQQ